MFLDFSYLNSQNAYCFIVTLFCLLFPIILFLLFRYFSQCILLNRAKVLQQHFHLYILPVYIVLDILCICFRTMIVPKTLNFDTPCTDCARYIPVNRMLFAVERRISTEIEWSRKNMFVRPALISSGTTKNPLAVHFRWKRDVEGAR